MTDVEDRTIGVLLGLAAGDRIGGPIRMALRVAESLLDLGGFDASDIAERYLTWWRSGAFDTGPTVARVLALTASGAPIEQASNRANEEAAGKTAGCNPAHRIAPLAMSSAVEDSRLEQAAISEARLTHRHPLAGEAAATVACLCRALMRGTEWPVALSLATEGRSSEICWAVDARTTGVRSRDGFAPHVLAAAAHFVETSPSFATALDRSLDFAGPANYCPVLVGSIGGARWGGSQIADALLRHHGALVPRLTKVAHGLAEGWRGV